MITLFRRVEIIKVLIMNSIPCDIDLRYELIIAEARQSCIYDKVAKLRGEIKGSRRIDKEFLEN